MTFNGSFKAPWERLANRSLSTQSENRSICIIPSLTVGSDLGKLIIRILLEARDQLLKYVWPAKWQYPAFWVCKRTPPSAQGYTLSSQDHELNAYL